MEHSLHFLPGSPPTSQHLRLCLGSWFSASSRCQAQRRAQWASVSHPAFVFHLDLCSASSWPSSTVHLSSFVHFSPSPRSLPSLCLSAAVSTPCLLSVFLFPSTALSVSPYLLSLPVFPSLPISVFSALSPCLCRPGWVRVGPGQPGPGAATNNAPFTRPVGAMATRPPRPPRPRAARAKRMPWLRQARARPARHRPARS